MSSVSQIVRDTEQPVFGILPLRYFEKKELKQDNYKLSVDETISAMHVGLIIDYCTKYSLGVPLQEIVYIEMAGYAEHLRMDANKFFHSESEQSTLQVYMDDVEKEICISNFMANVKKAETFEDFVKSMYYVIQYGDLMRNSGPYAYYRSSTVFDTVLSENDIKNILICYIRTHGWISKFDKVTPMYRFKPYGYNNTVTAGEGDFCTKNTLWDLKVSDGEPTTKDTLQLLIYYIMAKCSGNRLYAHVDSVGIYNPKMDATWICNMNKVDRSIVNSVQLKLGLRS